MKHFQTCLFFAAAVLPLFFSAAGAAQQGPTAEPALALTAAISAACRADQSQFANYLTADSAAAFRRLPADERSAFLERFSLSGEAGRALVSSGPQNQPVVRCQAGGATVEFRLGAGRAHDNLAFIHVDVVDSESIDFGLVREDGAWHLLSLGLVVLDVPQLAKQWAEADLAGHEDAVISTLNALAEAVQTYRRAYGKLPDSLGQMGPAPKGEISPEQADLVDDQLAAGNGGGYSFRYRIVSPTDGASPEGDTFELAATPGDYGKAGRRSFFMDAAGKIHGADRHGEIAAASDPLVAPVQQSPDSGSAPAVQ